MYTNTITTTIPDFIDQTLIRLNQFTENEWVEKPSSEKWSRKEILGHLIDSAMTNIRRLIITQYQQNEKIVYAQDEWVKYGAYHSMLMEDLIFLWSLINRQYHRISISIPTASLEYTCDTSKDEISLTTLSFLIQDYWGHQQHHLRQLFKE